MTSRFAFAPAAALVLLAQTAIAQSPAGSETRLGPFLGANFTSFGGADATGSSGHTFLGVGLQVQHALHGGAFLSSGVFYMNRGAEVSDQGIVVVFKEAYIEVPALVGYEFSQGSSRPYIIGGAQLGFQTSCKLEATSGGQSASINCDDSSVGLNMSSTDWAFVGGGGVSFAAGHGTIGLDLRYALGMQNIETSSDIKNRGFTVGASYMFPLGKH